MTTMPSTTLRTSLLFALAGLAACGDAELEVQASPSQPASEGAAAPGTDAPTSSDPAPTGNEGSPLPIPVGLIRAPGIFASGELTVAVTLRPQELELTDGSAPSPWPQDLVVESAWSVETPEEPERLAQSLVLKDVAAAWFVHPDESETTMWCFDGRGTMGIQRIATEDRGGEAIFVTLDQDWNLEHRVPEAFYEALPEAVRARSGR